MATPFSSHEEKYFHLDPSHISLCLYVVLLGGGLSSTLGILMLGRSSRRSCPPSLYLPDERWLTSLPTRHRRLVLGGYFCSLNQISFFLKERLFISSALISVCIGIGELDWLSSFSAELTSALKLDSFRSHRRKCHITMGVDERRRRSAQRAHLPAHSSGRRHPFVLCHSRTPSRNPSNQLSSLTAEVMFAGISLPGAYLKREALSLTMLLLPIMICAWFVSGGFIKLFVPSLTFLEALCISSCVTPTDPILANA
jgi:sodium/hydrogen antiporter